MGEKFFALANCENGGQNMHNNSCTDKKKLAIGLFVFLLTACVTINIYFPAAEVQKTAEEIVSDVRGADAKNLDRSAPENKDSEAGPVSFMRLGISKAYAARELDVSNATIRTLKGRIKQNYPRLRKWLAKGVLGEGYNGYVVMRQAGSLNLKAKVEAKRVMQEENSNRKALYAAVASALNIQSSQVSRVGRIFAQQWQRAVPPGTWIETAPGKWIRR